MKKVIIVMLCLGMLMVGCGKNNAIEHKDAQSKSTAALGKIHEKSNQETETSEITKRMVMLDGRLYVDTGELGRYPTCGLMDFSFNRTTDDIPTANGQTNFGKGYEGQYYIRENQIVIIIDEKPCIFAYNENDVEGIKMSVVNSTNRNAELQISNDTDLEWYYGEDFSLEKYDQKTGVWMSVDTVSGKYAFHDTAYTVKPGEKSKIIVDWKKIYGKLDSGKYRIIKEMYYMTLKSSNPEPTHIFSAEFAIK